MHGDHDHPYSAAFESNDIAYVSGALPIGADGVVIGGRKTALEAALPTIEQRLSTVGPNLTHVMKLT